MRLPTRKGGLPSKKASPGLGPLRSPLVWLREYCLRLYGFPDPTAAGHPRNGSARISPERRQIHFQQLPASPPAGENYRNTRHTAAYASRKTWLRFSGRAAHRFVIQVAHLPGRRSADFAGFGQLEECFVTELHSLFDVFENSLFRHDELHHPARRVKSDLICQPTFIR